MKHHFWLTFCVCAGLLLIPLGNVGASSVTLAWPGVSPAGQAPAAPQAPADVPFTLVASGATSFTIKDPKVFWYSLPPCTSPPPHAPSTILYETIQRIATYGSPTRTLYSHQVNAICPSNNDVVSNIVSDGTYVYWISSLDGGLVKLSVSANVGDKPTVVNTTSGVPSEIRLHQGSLFVLTQPGGSLGCILYSINLTTGATTLLADAGAGATDFQSDSTYLYWNKGGTLHQWDIAAGKEKNTIATGVTGYHSTGAKVYYGQGKVIYRFDNATRTADKIHTSSDASARVYLLAFDNSELFWFEDHTLTCVLPCLSPSHDDALFRSGAGGGSPTEIYLFHAGTNPQASNLRTDANILFWIENGPLQRLPEDASALPQINLVADSLEVTQGIQNTSNTVPLIRGRATYVRFYVHSAGAAVPGVVAWLYRTNSVGTVIDGPLPAANPGGGFNPPLDSLTVLPSPRRNVLNDSFLFQLPWNWVNGSSLYLKAVMNPDQYPLEPNYSDNTATFGGSLLPSPVLGMYLIMWQYYLNGNLYTPTLSNLNIYMSWIRRAYPLASTDFNPVLYYIEDDNLGSHVNQTAPTCTNSLCASAYADSQMQIMREVWPVPDNIHMHGEISDLAGIFPRGITCCGTHTSTSPAGTNGSAWDNFDYSGWYGGHETGHSLGRKHPSSSAAKCGNSASDPLYPYPLGHIGPNNGSMEGFDVGDSLGQSLAIYPGTTWNDVMTYCVPNQWISDYTYLGMYNYMIANPPSMPSAAGPVAPSLTGNWLAVNGEIVTSATSSILAHVPAFRALATSAILSSVRHLSTIASIPPLVPGPDYSIELFSAGNNLLASYPFTPQPATSDAPNWLPFTEVVTDVANTAQLRIVRLADNATLASQNIPAHAPTVGNVQLVGAPNPVTGVVTLSWTSGDVDGNPLTFDIWYSRDGGATVQQVKVGVSGNSTAIDTSHLGGGGTAILRVIASDGVNTAQADSAPFTMASKPPQPMILAPADGTQRHYGQLVNFSGAALDAQDGNVDPARLAWSDQKGALGTGALLSVSDLPVGMDVITLTATDSANQKATASITVVVDDNLDLPGPTLSVGPQQFGWSFATSADPTQTDTLTLDNVGGGSLSWTATTDASWLKLDITSGTAPSQITLTANPAGIPNNTVHDRHVFINVPAGGGSPAEQISVPVEIAVGVSPGELPGGDSFLYLPFISR